MSDLPKYDGRGEKHHGPKPGYIPADGVEDPGKYEADPGLAAAVNVAIQLRQPLLLTGEPGTGKTDLAHSVAWELEKPLEIFNAKTTSTARDLFYQYDALQHFHATHRAKDGTPAPDVRAFLHVHALGRAIVRASAQPAARAWLGAGEAAAAPAQSVVLVDEIDKAPRDLPNDVLNEFDRMQFKIDEMMGEEPYCAQKSLRPILLITSNTEKTLPDAFLRRCVYYHIPFPTPERLKEIVVARLGDLATQNDAAVKKALETFVKVREDKGKKLKKPPATAECIAWISLLLAQGIAFPDARDDKPRFAASLSVLAKSKEDLELLKSKFGV